MSHVQAVALPDRKSQINLGMRYIEGNVLLQNYAFVRFRPLRENSCAWRCQIYHDYGPAAPRAVCDGHFIGARAIPVTAMTAFRPR